MQLPALIPPVVVVNIDNFEIRNCYKHVTIYVLTRSSACQYRKKLAIDQ